MQSVELICERVKTGNPRYMSFEIPDNYRHALAHLFRETEAKKPARYRLTIEQPKKRRSLPSNRELHRVIYAICNETGNDFADVKLYLKRAAMRRGYPPKTDDKGNVVYSMLDGEAIPQSESDATQEHENMLIEEAHQLAAELGVVT